MASQRDLAERLLSLAREDGIAARAMLNVGVVTDAIVGFHAQQAVEKALKAFLVWHQLEFPKTHDLSLLLELCASVDAGLAESLADAEELTPYGVDYRYPGEQAPVTREDAEAALKIARAAVHEVAERLPNEPSR